MGWERNSIFMHAPQALGKRGNLNFTFLPTDRGACPQLTVDCCSLCKGELRQKKGKNYENFSERNGGQ